MGQNMRVRKLLIGLTVTMTAVVAGVVGADFGAAIYAEYRWSRTVREAANLNFDPWVGIIGFPFATQAIRRHYDEVEIRASGVNHPVVGKVGLEATMYSVGLHDAGWLAQPAAELPVGRLESRVIIDSTHVGRSMGITDLLVEAPTGDSDDDNATTESGISTNRGVVFTGTPRKSGLDKRVSIAVDLSVAGPGDTTLVVTATHVLTGPGTADEAVPDDRRDAVLAEFSSVIPGQKLPFGLHPTSLGARGSDVIIEGVAQGVTVTLDGFNQS